jgi:integrase
MPRPRTGGIKQLEDGTFQVRISYTGADGKRHERLRKDLSTITAARKVLREFLEGLETRGQKAVEGDKLTFRRLAAIYEEQHVFDAQYVQSRKVAGLRSVAPVRTYLKVLNSHFANELVINITRADIQKFKLARLKVPTVRNSQRSISAVNRELALLRRLFNFAIENRWVKENPFNKTKLISSGDEVSRDRVLSFDEERRLLDACDGAREHLRGIIIAALDTGCRFGELLKLRWNDIDFAGDTISIIAFNTKTAEAREVGMTDRVRNELLRLRELAPQDSDTLVFGIQSSIKRSWKTACAIAAIDDFRFHDLRHTAITRLVATGLPSAEIMRISGHKQSNTFLRYVNPKSDSLRRAASLLSAYNQSQSTSLIESVDSIQ